MHNTYSALKTLKYYSNINQLYTFFDQQPTSAIYQATCMSMHIPQVPHSTLNADKLHYSSSHIYLTGISSPYADENDQHHSVPCLCVCTLY
jgi:hypothetical protein